MTIFYFVLGNLPAIFQLTFPSTIDKKTLAFKEQRSLQRVETYRRIPVTLDAKEIEFESYGGKTEEIVSRDNTRSGIQNPIESSQFVERSRSLSVLFLFFFFSFLLPLKVSRRNTARMIRSSRFLAVARIEFLGAVTPGRSCRDANSSRKSRS